jgi:hypothetical protein
VAATIHPADPPPRITTRRTDIVTFIPAQRIALRQTKNSLRQKQHRPQRPMLQADQAGA